MDKKETLINCRDHWKYLADTGADDKDAYFEHIEENPPVASCYCCGYDDYLLDSSKYAAPCNFCPLIGYAWNGGVEACLRGDSPYREWRMHHEEDGGSIEERKLYARMIVRACNLALADLEESNG